MINEIFIEGKRLDLSEGLSNLITYAIDDIKDIGSRNTSFSKTIVLPGTANNNALFGNIFDFTQSNFYDPGVTNVGYNFNPSKKADCIIFQNHLQVFKGILRLLKVVIENGTPEYECVVFGELGGLINAIGASKLQDLDFSAYDRILSVTNVSGSWDNTPGSGVFFPLIDYGNVSTDKIDYDILAFRPALYVKEYIDKIFTAAGYSYSSAIMNTDRFKRLVIPHNQKELTKNENNWIVSERDYTTGGGYDATIIEGTGTSTPAANYIFWDSAELANFTGHLSAGQYDYFTYTPLNNGLVDIQLNIRGKLSNDRANIYVEIRQNGSPLQSYLLRDTGGNLENFELIETLTGVTVANPDVFDVRISSDDAGPYQVDVEFGTFNVISVIPAIVTIGLGDTIRINDTIPRNILQRDFLSSIAKLFNLYIYEDKLKSKFVNMTPYVDYYNVSGVVDWTYKLDRSKKIQLATMSELNSRFYDFKFKGDNDYYNELYFKRYGEVYGSYLFDSEFAFSGDKTEIELIFSPTPLVGYSGVDKIVSAIYKNTNGTEERQDFNIRILQTKKITGVTHWKIKDGASTIQSGITSYGYAGHYDDPDAPANDIHFGVPKELFFSLLSGGINVTQFNVYWSSYMAEITDKDSKLFTGMFRLTNQDIYDLDFSKFVYLDGSLFRLNKLSDYNTVEPDLTQAELLKVINIFY